VLVRQIAKVDKKQRPHHREGLLKEPMEIGQGLGIGGNLFLLGPDMGVGDEQEPEDPKAVRPAPFIFMDPAKGLGRKTSDS